MIYDIKFYKDVFTFLKLFLKSRHYVYSLNHIYLIIYKDKDKCLVDTNEYK